MRSKNHEGLRRLRIRRDRLRQLGRRKFGAETDIALAVAIGIDNSNLCHLFNGRRQPSAETIVLLLDMFDVEFEDLFERYHPQPATARAAAA